MTDIVAIVDPDAMTITFEPRSKAGADILAERGMMLRRVSAETWPHWKRFFARMELSVKEQNPENMLTPYGTETLPPKED